jgi:predicted  nucleic acid-binding Zn-ribbon protein
MAKQPDDMVMRILQNIQQTLADHTRRFDGIDQRFDRVERQLEESNADMIAALGLASHVNVRNAGIQKDIDELKKRVERLEEKL